MYVLDNDNTIEDEGNKFLKNFSFTGFVNENLAIENCSLIEAMENGCSTGAEFGVDNYLESIKLHSLNDTNLPKDVYFNMCQSKLKPNEKLQLSKPTSQLNKQSVTAETRKPLGSNKSYTLNFHVPLSVLPNLSNYDKREHSGVPFNRTGRSATRVIFNINKENINIKPNDKLQLSKPTSQLNKQSVTAETRKPLGSNKSYTPNVRVPLSVKPNLSNNNSGVVNIKYLPRVVKPKPATMPQSPKLSTSIRVEKRNKFNLQLKEKESQMRIIKQKENEIKESVSKKIENFKKELVHKPEPIRKYQS